MAVTVSQSFLVFGDHDRSTGQIFCRLPLNCNLSDVFSYTFGLWVFGRKTTEVRVHLIIYQITYPVDVTLNHLAEVGLVRFLYHKITFFSPFSYCTLWKEVIIHSAMLKEQGVILHLESVYLHKLCGISLQGIFVYSPICLFNQFISVWVHRYLFYTLCYNLILPYLFCCSDSLALAIGSALSWV